MATVASVPTVVKPYLVTGLPAADNFPRLEIRDLQKKPEQLTLFLHSLAAIMSPEHRPKASRFADLGGIHGLPYERWNGDPAVDDDVLPAGTLGGYCYHESVLFPTWHRPYLLAIEQSIGEVATRLARRWTRNSTEGEKATWALAAKELRFPFWDWSNLDYAKDGLPNIFQTQTYTFQVPGRGDQPTTINNPLASFDFGSRHPDGFENFIWKTPLASQAMSFFKDWQRTYRWPTGKLNPTDDYIKIKEKLAGTENERGSCLQLRNAVSKLFSYPPTVEGDREATTWDEFSNTTFQSKNNTKWEPHGLGSLESPHNSVHLILGGLGVMAENDYAAFDPIFYLHHCNVDRILAFWEYVYESYWMGNGYKDREGKDVAFTQSGGTWAADENDNLTEATALQPFRKADNTYWNSTNTRLQQSHGIAKGYTYPPISSVSIDTPLPSDPAQRLKERQRCIGILQTHFANPATFSGFRLTHPFLETAAISPPPQHDMIRGYRHFTVQVQLVGHAFNGSYWLQLLCKEKVIGSFAVLTRGEGTRCAACVARHKAGGQVHGIIDIPEDVIHPILEDIVRNDPNAETDSVIRSFKKCFSARIVGPSDVLLAEAVESNHRVPLESSIVPELVLLSAAAASPVSGRDGPIQLFDWKDHGDFLSDVKWTPI